MNGELQVVDETNSASFAGEVVGRFQGGLPSEWRLLLLKGRGITGFKGGKLSRTEVVMPVVFSGFNGIKAADRSAPDGTVLLVKGHMVNPYYLIGRPRMKVMYAGRRISLSLALHAMDAIDLKIALGEG